ncbi:DEKNAAC103544 [Brettanomyces naardenensis]|uniref:FAD synthase n=1 Tax=Brettanomyces naardenensis TaxID=13370 RepID=A0A448YN37_BRENA|nr:DEKNAAC103544 [Brettanomyces naardenensis]
MFSYLLVALAMLTGWSAFYFRSNQDSAMTRDSIDVHCARVCHQCHNSVYQFLNSSFDDTFIRLDYLSKKVSNQPVPDFYTPSLHRETQSQVRNTLKIYEEILDTYSLDELSISYNGGKDCLVMLIIYLAAIHEHFQSKQAIEVNSVYINNEETFPEQDQFLEKTVKSYGLDFTPIKSDMRAGFENYLELKPDIKAIIVGIRRIDPYGAKLHVSQRTDHGWPDFVRLNPVLEWTTCEIWYFLKATATEYCSLYDKGFTSLGGRNTTIRNPLLKEKDGVYLPAYMLHDDNNERLSRVSDTEKKKLRDEKL